MKEQNVQTILGGVEIKSKMEYYIDDFIEAEIEVKYFYKGDNSKRFVLGEVIGPNPLICFGVNPSTAKVINKQLEIDCTIKNIKKIVIKEKYDGWIMLNLYPEVSTKFSDLNNILMNRLHNINLYVIEKILSYLEEELKPKDKNDSKNVIIEIRGAAGGDEANIFAGDLFRMYLKYCEKENFKVNILSEDSSDTGGFTYVSFAVKGKNVYSKLKYESGAHRVQRIPVTETQGRVHTSTATVLVMPENEEIEIDINMEDIRVDVYRSSGKGGQGVNTTDSAVRLTHIPTNIVVTCQSERSQIQNKETALKVLKNKLYLLEKEKQENEKNSNYKGQKNILLQCFYRRSFFLE